MEEALTDFSEYPSWFVVASLSAGVIEDVRRIVFRVSLRLSGISSITSKRKSVENALVRLEFFRHRLRNILNQA